MGLPVNLALDLDSETPIRRSNCYPCVSDLLVEATCRESHRERSTCHFYSSVVCERCKDTAASTRILWIPKKVSRRKPKYFRSDAFARGCRGRRTDILRNRCSDHEIDTFATNYLTRRHQVHHGGEHACSMTFRVPGYSNKRGFDSTPSKSTISFTAPNHKRPPHGNHLIGSFNPHTLAAPSDVHAMNVSRSESTA
jgi:hypothetical protein